MSRGRSVIMMVMLSLIAGCAVQPFGREQFALPCKAVQITGTMQMGLNTVRVVSEKGVAYELRETENCRYECPKPAGKVSYIAIGNEPNVIAYYPIGDQFIYMVRGCLDDSEPGRKILHASFVSCKKR